MALLSSYSEANMNVVSKESVRYSAEPYIHNSNSTAPITLYWNVTRTKQESYEYIGMTKAAAEQCLADMREKYLRKYSRWTVVLVDSETSSVPVPVISEFYVIECSTNIKINRNDSGAWSVQVDVNETDNIISVDELTTVEQYDSLFQLADARDGSAGGGNIAITSAKWTSTGESGEGSIKINFEPFVANYDKNNVGIQVTLDDGENWTTVPVRVRHDQDVSFRCTDCGLNTNKTFRLTYVTSGQSITSAPWTTKDVAVPSDFVITSVEAENIETAHGDTTIGSYYISFTIYFTADSGTWAGLMQDRSKYSVWIGGKQYTFDGETYSCRYFNNLGDNKYSISGFARTKINYIDGLDFGVEYNFNGSYIESNTFNFKPEKWIEFDGDPDISAEQTTVTLSLDFQSNMKEADVLANTTLTFNDRWSTASAKTVTVNSVTKLSSGKYHINATVVNVGNCYGGGSARIVLKTKEGTNDYVSTLGIVVGYKFVFDIIEFTVSVGGGDVLNPGTMTVHTGETVSWDWGDGSTVETGLTAAPAPHTYTTSGEYTIKITGKVDSIDCGEYQNFAGGLPISDFYAGTLKTIGRQALHNCTGKINAPRVDSVGQGGVYYTEQKSPTPEITLGILNYADVDQYGIGGNSRVYLFLPLMTEGEVKANLHYPWSLITGSYITAKNKTWQILPSAN